MGLLRVSRCTLWLGPDHLLAVDNHGYSEDYKRFYLKDIQAITLVRNAAGIIRAWLLAGWAFAAVLLVLLALAFRWPVGLTVAGSIVAAFFLLCLLVNRLRGPTCTGYLQTAVQTERLYSLNHVRQAEKVLARLAGLVEATQGALSPEQTAELQAAAENLVRAQPVDEVRPAAGSPARARGKLQPDVRHLYNSRAHGVLVGVLLTDLVYEALTLVSPGRGLFIVGLLVSIALVGATVMALIRQHSTDLRGGLKIIAWLSMAYLFVGYLFGTIYSSVFMMSNPELAGNSWRAARALATSSPLDSPGRLAMTIFSMICAGGLGLTGAALLAVGKPRPAARPQPDG